MPNVAIITDSTNCIPKPLIKEYDINVLPTTLTINGKLYLDEIDISPDEFWEMMPSFDRMPSGSGVRPGEFIDCFTRLAPVTDKFVCIVMSKGIGVSYSSAQQAKEMIHSTHPGLTVEVIDSRASSGGLGFIVLEAARAAKAGKSLAEVLTVVQNMIPRVKHFTGVHSLKFLHQYGRMPASIAPAGIASDNSPLNIKTIISVSRETGQVEFIGKYRGMQNANQGMIDKAKEYLKPDREAHFMVHYSHDIHETDALRKLIQANFKCKELYISQFTAGMLASTGPQFGMAFYSD